MMNQSMHYLQRSNSPSFSEDFALFPSLPGSESPIKLTHEPRFDNEFFDEDFYYLESIEHSVSDINLKFPTPLILNHKSCDRISDYLSNFEDLSDFTEFESQYKATCLANIPFENNTEIVSKALSLSPQIKKNDGCRKAQIEEITSDEKRRKRSSWETFEDKQVQDLVNEYGEKWTIIAGIIGNRTPKQIRDRYTNFLKAGISNNKFTQHEDSRLLQLQKEYGNQWAQIASHMPGRTEGQVKNRYHGHLKKIISKVSPSPFSSSKGRKGSEESIEIEDSEFEPERRKKRFGSIHKSKKDEKNTEEIYYNRFDEMNLEENTKPRMKTRAQYQIEDKLKANKNVNKVGTMEEGAEKLKKNMLVEASREKIERIVTEIVKS